MKMLRIAVPLAFAAATLSAQPAKDILDAQAMARAQERDMQPAIEQMREMGIILGMFANVQRELSNAPQPNTALDKAIAAIDDYTVDSVRRSAVIDRDMRSVIDRARRMLDAARVGPPLNDVTDIREKLHHNFIHPLQRRSVQMARQIDVILRSYESLSTALRNAQSSILGSLERTAFDPEKP